METTASLHTSNDQFPPGFRFHPTDQELIIHYLTKKITSTLPPSSAIIADIDLYKFNPWQLPEKAFFGEGEWFFFSPRERKYPNGVRPNRAAACGYWKATGTDKPILASDSSHCLGVKKALVFYKGRPPKGIKTDWLMHEYRLLDSTSSMSRKLRGTMRLDDWVLCRVRQRGSLLIESDQILAPVPAPVQSIFIKSRESYESYQFDYQLMSYLLDSVSQPDIADENSELLPCRDDGRGLYMGEQQHPELVTSMLGSIKRKLSFGSMDELMMLQPDKMMYQFTAGRKLSQ